MRVSWQFVSKVFGADLAPEWLEEVAFELMETPGV